jgi:hypothetical protein
MTDPVPGIVQVRVCWDRAEIPLRVDFHIVRIGPESGYPFGRRGLALVSAWRQLAAVDTPGMLVLDGDVAVDPVDYAAMLAAIVAEPAAVHVAPVRLWPISTHVADWVWGHGRAVFSQDDPDNPDVFTFSFTYLPRALIEACITAGMGEWTYPGVDRRVCEQSRTLRVPVHVVRGAAPKHVNF